jgi:hypothetical protein
MLMCYTRHILFILQLDDCLPLFQPLKALNHFLRSPWYIFSHWIRPGSHLILTTHHIYSALPSIPFFVQNMCGDSHLPAAPESGDLVAVIHPNSHSTFRGRLKLSNRLPGATASSLQCENLVSNHLGGANPLKVRIQ